MSWQVIPWVPGPVSRNYPAGAPGTWLCHYISLILSYVSALLSVFFDTRAAAEKGNEKENLQIPAAIKGDCFRDR